MLSYAPFPCPVFCSVLVVNVCFDLGDILFVYSPHLTSPVCCSLLWYYMCLVRLWPILKYLDVLCNVSRKHE